MKVKLSILIIYFILLLTPFRSFGGFEDRVLLYYFENISGDESYSPLMYMIPVCLYNHLGGTMQDKEFILIDKEGLQALEGDDKRILWDRTILSQIAEKKHIQEVIFGQFYVEKAKVILFVKVFYLKSGLILDITDKSSDYYEPIYNNIDLNVDVVMNCKLEHEERTYKPPIRRLIGDKTLPSRIQMLNVTVGPFFPLSDWDDIYPWGLFNELMLSIFPKLNRLPFGFGIHTGIAYTERPADTDYLASDMAIFPLGVSLQYMINLRSFINSVMFDASTGFSYTKLTIYDDTWFSTDFYVKLAMGLVFGPVGEWYFPLKVGIMSVAYRDDPIDFLFCEIGLLFRKEQND